MTGRCTPGQECGALCECKGHSLASWSVCTIKLSHVAVTSSASAIGIMAFVLDMNIKTSQAPHAHEGTNAAFQDVGCDMKICLCTLNLLFCCNPYNTMLSAALMLLEV